jgi:hypothetical protein
MLPPRFFSTVALLMLPGLAAAQAPARTVVATSNSPAATFSARTSDDKPFQVLPDKAPLYAGDLLVSLPGGRLTTKNMAVTVKALSDFDGRSPLPILETALKLVESKDTDLDLTLDRGRIDITNVKPEGAATVRVRFRDQVWIITLDSPGTRVTMESCGRWPAGTRFRVLDESADLSKTPAPVATIVLLVLEGTASVAMGGITLGLKAPPGPAELRWNSLTGARPQPLKLEKLPDWADTDAVPSEEARKAAEAVEKFRQARAADPEKALDTFLASANPAEQRVALVALGAQDELARVGKALAEAQSMEQWDFGITVLRHWLGRSRGQDQKLYSTLMNARGFSAPQARIATQLLFGFSEEDLGQPETYEVLIDYLLHEKAGIRNLAAWHLVRLVPKGKEIPYRPNGTLEEAQKAHDAWKKLVPSGRLPVRGKMKEE